MEKHTLTAREAAENYSLEQDMQDEQIFARLGAIMAELPPIPKDQRNEPQRYNFRGIDDVMNTLHGPMQKHGVFCWPEVVDSQQDILTSQRGTRQVHTICMVKFHFVCKEDGSTLTVGPVRGEGLDTSDKSSNKAMSAALKYALLQTFMIPTEDMDDSDRGSPQLGNGEPGQESKAPAQYYLEEVAEAPQTSEESLNEAKMALWAYVQQMRQGMTDMDSASFINAVFQQENVGVLDRIDKVNKVFDALKVGRYQWETAEPLEPPAGQGNT